MNGTNWQHALNAWADAFQLSEDEWPRAYADLEKRETLDLKYREDGRRKITHLPAEIGQLRHIKNISLTGQQISALPAELFDLPQLRQLDIGRNPIKEIPFAIKKLQKLRFLTINDCQISQLPATIGTLSKLLHLIANNNHLTCLPAEIFHLPNLLILNLAGNPLASLPPEIKNLRRLRALNFCHTMLTELPIEIKQLTKLEKLNEKENPQLETDVLQQLARRKTHTIVHDSKYTQINKSGNNFIPAASALNLTPKEASAPEPWLNALIAWAKVYDIERCHIPHHRHILREKTTTALVLSQERDAILKADWIPAEVCQMQHLERLVISGIKIGNLPPEICQLSNLQELFLENCEITQLPTAISHLQKLHTLVLYHNQLKTLPPEIGNLQKLTTLDLGDNPLQTLPPEIGKLQQLTRLDMDSAIKETGTLTHLPAEIIQLKNLRFVRLCGHPQLQLTDAQKHFFHQLEYAKF